MKKYILLCFDLIDERRITMNTGKKFYLKDRYDTKEITLILNVSEIIQYLKKEKLMEEKSRIKSIYIPHRVEHGIFTDQIHEANWQLWANHYGYDVTMIDTKEEEPLFIEKWWLDDITNIMVEEEVPLTEDNIQAAIKAVTPLFEDHSYRNDQISQTICEVFKI